MLVLAVEVIVERTPPAQHAVKDVDRNAPRRKPSRFLVHQPLRTVHGQFEGRCTDESHARGASTKVSDSQG
jgi:hypothetical protein